MWLANVFYFLSLLSPYKGKKLQVVFSTLAVLLAVVFPFVFWGESLEDNIYVNDLGPGYWTWLAAFIVGLVDAMKWRKRLQSGKQDLVT